MTLTQLQQLYATHPNVAALRTILSNNSIKHIFCGGLNASSASLFFSACMSDNRLPYVFILGDLEEAGYFYHDLVQIAGNEKAESSNC